MVQEQYTSLPREELLISIGNAKKALSEDYHRCKKAASELTRVLKKYNGACERYARRASVSNESRLQGIMASARTAYGELLAVKQNLIENYDSLMAKYATLEELGGSKREMKALRRRIEQLTESHSENMQRSLGNAEEGLPAFLYETVIDSDVAASGSGTVVRDTVGDEVKSHVGAQTRSGGEVGVATVGIAPITIDISDIVERSVSKAIERLNARLAKRIDEFVDSISFPIVDGGAAVAQIKTEIKNEIKSEIKSEINSEIKHETKVEINREAKSEEATNATVQEHGDKFAECTVSDSSCATVEPTESAIPECVECSEHIEAEIISEDVGTLCAHACTEAELYACEENAVGVDVCVADVCEESTEICGVEPCDHANRDETDGDAGQ